MYFEIYQSGGLLTQEWRWRLKGGNHQIIADGSEGYKNRTDCLHGINLVKQTNIYTPIR